MQKKRNLKYKIKPKSIGSGDRWIDFEFSNQGDQDLTGLVVRLNSQDTFGITIIEGNRYVPVLKSGEKTTVFFRILANAGTRLYVSIDGFKDGSPFYWESPSRYISVGKPEAELMNLFAMTKPRFIIGDKIRVEASVRSNVMTEGLSLEFWTEDPDENIEEVKSIDTGTIDPGQMKVFSGEFTPDKEGIYTIDTYLYDGTRRLGHKTDFVYVGD